MAQFTLIGAAVARRGKSHFTFQIKTNITSHKFPNLGGKVGRAFCFAAALVALAGCSKSPSSPPVADAPIVRTARIAAATDVPGLEATGSVALRRELALGFTTAGQIATITVNEGDRVAKGQLLAALNADQVASALVAAQAEQRRAAAEYQRSVALREQGWITELRLENARAALDAARANVRARDFASQTARIYAPSDGVVLARMAEPMEVVAAGTPIIALGAESGGYVLRVPLSDRDSAQITQGARAQVKLDALDQVLEGQVIEIGGRSDRATGAFTVEISLPNRPGLRSGLIGRVKIETAPSARASAQVLVPPGALYQARAGEGFVFVIDEKNVARLRKLQLGETDDRGTQILAGLRPGDRVAISSLDLLRDGQRVTPQERRP